MTGGHFQIIHYDPQGRLIAETDGTGQTLVEYIYLDDEPLAMIGDESVFYYHTDHLGTPQVMTDANGTVVWSALYSPFGNATVTTSTIENNLRFPGQYYDAETGLHYNYHRYYNPKTGRYITADPIGLMGGVNLYGYVGGNPVRWVDPRGKKVYYVGIGFSGFLSSSLGSKTGTVSSSSVGVALDTSTWGFHGYKSITLSSSKVTGLGIGIGPIGGVLNGDIKDFYGTATEHTAITPVGSLTSVLTDIFSSGKQGWSVSIGGKGWGAGETVTTTYTTPWHGCSK
jgi:RHS repeat-associated protein